MASRSTTFPAGNQIVLKCADSQLRRRPQSGANVQRAANAFGQILRQDPAEAKAAEKLVELYLLTNDKVSDRRIARLGTASDIASLATARSGKPSQRANMNWHCI